MRILHVIDSLKPGGAERMLIDLANATHLDGRHQVAVCVTLSEAYTQLVSDLHPDIPCMTLGRMGLHERSQKNVTERLFRELKAIRDFPHIANQYADVLHAHSRSTVALLTLLRTLRLIYQPIIMHDHYGEIEVDQSIPKWFGSWGRQYVAQYAGVSDKLVDWAHSAGIPRQKTQVMGNALDLNRLRKHHPLDLHKTFKIPRDQLNGIVVGGIRAQKGIDLLLEALQYSHQRDRCHILIVGADRDAVYGTTMRQQADQLGFNITFTGERRDVPGLIQSADFALIPSRSESGPLVLIEYLAIGLPVVAFETGNIAALSARQGVPGFIPPADVRAFAKALDDLLLLDDESRCLRGQKGLAMAENCFNINRKMADWYQIYEKALA